LVLPTKRLVAAGKYLVAARKFLFVLPNFVAVTKPFFSVYDHTLPSEIHSNESKQGVPDTSAK